MYIYVMMKNIHKIGGNDLWWVRTYRVSERRVKYEVH